MAILTNAARSGGRGARFALPVDRLGARLPAGMDAAEAAAGSSPPRRLRRRIPPAR